MSSEGFLADILAHPHDDTPRLIYADWLEDHGDPERAEFIRIQIELHQLSAHDSRRAELLARQHTLLQASEGAWQADLPNVPGVAWQGWSRGFMDAVRINSAKAFRDSAAAVFGASPVMDLELGKQVTSRTLPTILASPLLTSLTRISIFDAAIGDSGAKAIANCPHFCSLKSLFLGSCRIGPTGAIALARSPHLISLKELHLDGNPLGDVGVDALASSPFLSQVEVLHLTSAQIGHAGVGALARSKYVAAVRELRLGQNLLGNSGARTLANSTQLISLERLILISNSITDEGVASLASMTGLPALTELHLGGNLITNAGAATLSAGRGLDRLKRLTIYSYDGRIGAEGIAALRERFGDRVEVR